jgi:hypothetical protein
MRECRAADYLDMSLPMFKKFVSAGIFSPPREIDSIKAFDREQLDRDIDALPFAGGPAMSDTSWDD